MAETTFLSEQGVLVTSARFVVPPMWFVESGQTYAMSAITSVRTEADFTERIALIIVAVAGGLMLVVCLPAGAFPTNQAGGALCVLMPVVLAVGGGVGAFLSRPNHKVFVTTAAGEKRVLWSKDGAFMDRVVAAVERAIVERG
jgi:hypothetical protein